jgi:hypothetical protein
MIICRSFVHPLQKNRAAFLGPPASSFLPFFAFYAYGRARPSV